MPPGECWRGAPPLRHSHQQASSSEAPSPGFSPSLPGGGARTSSPGGKGQSSHPQGVHSASSVQVGPPTHSPSPDTLQSTERQARLSVVLGGSPRHRRGQLGPPGGPPTTALQEGLAMDRPGRDREAPKPPHEPGRAAVLPGHSSATWGLLIKLGALNTSAETPEAESGPGQDGTPTTCKLSHLVRPQSPPGSGGTARLSQRPL